MDRLPPDLRDALNEMAQRVDDLDGALTATGEALREENTITREENRRRGDRWQAFSVLLAAGLLVVGTFAFATRQAVCETARALGALADVVPGEPAPTPRAARVGRSADRLGDVYWCPLIAGERAG